MLETDTIFALSSGALPSGVAVVRLSGPKAASVATAISGPLPDARMLARRTIRDRNNTQLDDALLVVFPEPASFTGETCVELHLHGGRATVAAVLDTLGSFAGLRPAEAGEFTRRALMNGKLDLAQAEGLGDVLAAETEMQRRLAQELASGRLSALYDGWARKILYARAMVEAELDFADEEDVPGSVSSHMWAELRTLVEDMSEHVRLASVSELIRDGFKIVVHGPPNVGKSSLINHLCDRDVAIVTDVAGTTRDIISVDMQIDGFAVRLFDTAGIHTTVDPVEIEGIRRARLALEEADLILSVSDGVRRLPVDPELASRTIRVRTKIDLVPVCMVEEPAIYISTKTGVGMDLLHRAIASMLPDRASFQAQAIPARARHAEGIRLALRELAIAIDAEKLSLELRSEHLRRASFAIERITGRTNVEDLLGVIFSSFCIGK